MDFWLNLEFALIPNVENETEAILKLLYSFGFFYGWFIPLWYIFYIALVLSLQCLSFMCWRHSLKTVLSPFGVCLSQRYVPLIFLDWQVYTFMVKLTIKSWQECCGNVLSSFFAKTGNAFISFNWVIKSRILRHTSSSQLECSSFQVWWL